MPTRQWLLVLGCMSVLSLLVGLFVAAGFSCCLAADPTAKSVAAPAAKPAGAPTAKPAADAPSRAAVDTGKLPIVVFIYSRECPVCAKVKPVVAELVKEYKSKARFVDLDVTDDQATLHSKKLAKELQLKSFFALYQDTFPCVGIFDTKMKCVKELFGANPKKAYVSYLDKVTR
jgi:thiol-disulfide isomerase/thioredoxin